MKPEEVIEAVKDFAARSHGEQKRKYSSEPYIVHPIRVMEICKVHTSDIRILSAALLHDVLEDTPVSKDELLMFLLTVMDHGDALETLDLVTDLTDVYIKEDYPQHNRKKRKSLERDRMAQTRPEAQTIKYADIIDNCREIVVHDRHFAAVFLGECSKVLERADKGDPELRRQAVQLLSDARRMLHSPA